MLLVIGFYFFMLLFGELVTFCEIRFSLRFKIGFVTFVLFSPFSRECVWILESGLVLESLSRVLLQLLYPILVFYSLFLIYFFKFFEDCWCIRFIFADNMLLIDEPSRLHLNLFSLFTNDYSWGLFFWVLYALIFPFYEMITYIINAFSIFFFKIMTIYVFTVIVVEFRPYKSRFSDFLTIFGMSSCKIFPRPQAWLWGKKWINGMCCVNKQYDLSFTFFIHISLP